MPGYLLARLLMHIAASEGSRAEDHFTPKNQHLVSLVKVINYFITVSGSTSS